MIDYRDEDVIPTEPVAMATLERMVTRHPDVFSGLARFLAAGFPVDIVLEGTTTPS